MIKYVKYVDLDSSVKSEIIDERENGMSAISIQRRHNITDKTFYRVLRENKEQQCNA